MGFLGEYFGWVLGRSPVFLRYFGWFWDVPDPVSPQVLGAGVNAARLGLWGFGDIFEGCFRMFLG